MKDTEKKRAAAHDYYLLHRAKFMARAKAWRAAHRERSNAIASASARRRRAANPEAFKALDRRAWRSYHAKNPHAARDRMRAMRARRRVTVPDDSKPML